MKFFLNKDKNVMEIVLYDLHNLPLPAPSFLALIKQEILIPNSGYLICHTESIPTKTFYIA